MAVVKVMEAATADMGPMGSSVTNIYHLVTSQIHRFYSTMDPENIQEASEERTTKENCVVQGLGGAFV